MVDPSSSPPSYEQLTAEVVELRALVVELREANRRLVERVGEPGARGRAELAQLRSAAVE